MPKFVRVKDNDTGYHLSVPEAAVAANPKAYTVLKQDATAASGAPLPPSYTSPGKKPAASASGETKSGHKAESKKES